jgi:hypothetical protein
MKEHYPATVRRASTLAGIPFVGLPDAIDPKIGVAATVAALKNNEFYA